MREGGALYRLGAARIGMARISERDGEAIRNERVHRVGTVR
jgi:hypothetical protein